MMGLPFVSFAVAVSVMELPLVTVVFPAILTLPSTGAAGTVKALIHGDPVIDIWYIVLPTCFCFV